jgi:hypothetical protein
VASEEFRSRCDGQWRELGKATLRGFSRSIAIFAPLLSEEEVQAGVAEVAREDKGHSDAENVVLLHRGGIQRAAR